MPHCNQQPQKKPAAPQKPFPHNDLHRLQTDLVIGLDDLDDVSSTNIAALEIVAANHLARADTRSMLATLAGRL